MNIAEAMIAAKDLQPLPDSQNFDLNEAMMVQNKGVGGIGTGFYNVGHAPRPLYTGYTGPGASIPDMDRDGIPDHIDYRYGQGQW